jgi:hypothetical protein
MRTALLIIGIFALLIGIVWILQGLNILGGSFMSGQPAYAVLGLVTGVIGLALMAFGLRRRSPSA